MPDQEHDAPPYIWLGPESTEKLRQALNDAGPGAHTRIYGHGEHTTLHVVRVGDDVRMADVGGGINDAHICPPDCR